MLDSRREKLTNTKTLPLFADFEYYTLPKRYWFKDAKETTNYTLRMPCPCPTETELELVCCKEIQLQIPHIRDEWPASFKFWWKQTLPSCHQIDASVKVDGGQTFWVFLRETPLEIWQASRAPPCYIMTYSPLGSCRGQILWHNYFYWRRCGDGGAAAAGWCNVAGRTQYLC